MGVWPVQIIDIFHICTQRKRNHLPVLEHINQRSRQKNHSHKALDKDEYLAEHHFAFGSHLSLDYLYCLVSRYKYGRNKPRNQAHHNTKRNVHQKALPVIAHSHVKSQPCSTEYCIDLRHNQI